MGKKNKTKFTIVYFIIFNFILLAQKPNRTDALVSFSNNGAPENIILTWKGNTSTTQAVTWRTDASIDSGFAEIAIADASPDFVQTAVKYTALTDTLTTEHGLKYYHALNFENLTQNTLYAYRVGCKDHWSEWFHFKTASSGPEPFSFIYFGDAQNNLLSLWSRTIRSAYSEAPKAKFMLHAGDLNNRANDDTGWREWFDAGDWLHAMVPSIPTPGNHEYAKDDNGNRFLSKFWKPQFTLPENGVVGLEESNYFIDYQNVRIISLNSNEKQEEQMKWLDDLLQNNKQKWIVVTYHHPLYSGGSGRDNKELRDLWKPIFDKYKVDIALQGHDHTYARGRNLTSGVNLKDNGGTMYVVSVSGPKMYKLTDDRWMDRAGQNTQLFQIISIDGDKLNYKAITVTGEVYDEFDLVKQKNKPNLLIDKNPGTPEKDYNSKD